MSFVLIVLMLFAFTAGMSAAQGSVGGGMLLGILIVAIIAAAVFIECRIDYGEKKK